MPATFITGIPADEIPVTDRAFHYDDEVFETIRVSHGRLTLWNPHRQRLIKGGQFLKFPLDIEALRNDLHRLLANNEPHGVTKILVSRGSNGRGYGPGQSCQPLSVWQFHPLPKQIDDSRSSGVSVKVCAHPLSTNSRLSPCKHLCRLDQILASMELSPEFAEGIMLTDNGSITVFLAYGWYGDRLANRAILNFQ